MGDDQWFLLFVGLVAVMYTVTREVLLFVTLVTGLLRNHDLEASRASVSRVRSQKSRRW
jgi:hypothetical protein